MSEGDIPVSNSPHLALIWTSRGLLNEHDQTYHAQIGSRMYWYKVNSNAWRPAEWTGECWIDSATSHPTKDLTGSQPSSISHQIFSSGAPHMARYICDELPTLYIAQDGPNSSNYIPVIVCPKNKSAAGGVSLFEVCATHSQACRMSDVARSWVAEMQNSASEKDRMTKFRDGLWLYPSSSIERMFYTTNQSTTRRTMREHFYSSHGLREADEVTKWSEDALAAAKVWLSGGDVQIKIVTIQYTSL